MLKVTNLLETIGSPQDLRDCDPGQLPQLAHDLREYILKSVAKTGGHLSSNLGTVELSLALHYVLTPQKTGLFGMWVTRVMHTRF